jgi:ribosomal protein S18 acetylase RimI-like enzyme
MDLRPFQPGDLDRIIQLTIDTFGPFYEDSFRGLMGNRIFQHQHGAWADDYRRTVPELHAPESNKFVVVAEDAGAIVGYVAWVTDPVKRHGDVDMLAVSEGSRRQHVGRALCEFAFTEMRKAGVEVVEIGTGGDDFHAPARAFYESLGMVKIPVAVYFREV